MSNDAARRATGRRKACGFGAALAAVAALGGLASKASADNNSTAILPADKFHLEFIAVGQQETFNGHTAIGLLYGLGPDKPVPFGRWEIGFDYVLSAGPFGGSFIPSANNPETTQPSGAFKVLSSQERLFGSIKTQLYENVKQGIRVSLGGYLLGAGDAEAGNLLFLAVSKQTQKYGYFHTGWVHSLASRFARATPSGNADQDYFQLDWAKPLTPRLIGGFNYYTGKSRSSVFFPAVIYFLTPTYEASVTAGLFHYNDSSVKPSRDQFYLQFDYYWDRVPHKPKMTMPPSPAPAGLAGF
ncbi:MAG TPA: hypothetical protein VKU00_24720 [Chthonomonadaceae bacterium]|nr:hypothetical protein [Chthonomonadaceae bacterium]